MLYLAVAVCPFLMLGGSLGVEGAEDTLASSTQGETVTLTQTNYSDEEELKDMCQCFSGKAHTKGNKYCLTKLLNYGPVISQGTCYGNLSTRHKRGYQRSPTSFSSPPLFIENKKCQGTKTIILASSGTERQLTLTTKASVFICQGSIDARLKQLSVTGVSKIVIAAGALKPRDSDLEIRFSNLQEKIVIPEEAFSVEITIQESTEGSDGVEIDMIHSPPPKVRLEIDTAEEVEFKSRSIVAPRVQVKLNQVKKVFFGSKSIIPYAHPEASSLEVSHSHSVTMESQTVNAGKFEVSHIKHLLMKERAVEVIADGGAGAKIENINNITLLNEALSLGSGADILLNNLTFTSAGVRSIQAIIPGNLRRAEFTDITGKHFASVAMCIKAQAAVIYNVEIEGENNNEVGACIEGRAIPQNASAGVMVICERLGESRNLCDDSRCSPCVPETNEGNTAILPTLAATSTAVITSASNFHHSTITSTNLTTVVTTPPIMFSTFGDTKNVSTPQNDINVPTTWSIVTISIPMDEVNVSTLSLSGTENNDTDINNFQDSRIPPNYIIIISVCAAAVLILFILFMIYRCYNRKKKDKYYLPHENRLSTFHNPRTIMTPDNLLSQSNTLKSNNADTPEIYTTYDSCREPTAIYTPSPETFAHESPCCPAETRLSYSEGDLPSASNQVIYAETEEEMLPPKYQPPSFNNQELPSEPAERHLPPADGYYHHPEEEMLPKDSHGGHLSTSKDHLPPPPDSYFHSSEEQMPLEDSLISEDEVSLSENCFPSPVEEQLHLQLPAQEHHPQHLANPSLANEHQVAILDQITTQNKQSPTQDIEKGGHENHLPTLNEETSLYDD